MNIVIIEDEQPAYKRLLKIITEVVPDVTVMAHHDSVGGAQKWFRENKAPDVVFMDIHLADGSAFDLLNSTTIDAPVVFTTAYDEYAIDAFKTASIGYLLKPIKKEALEETLSKLGDFKKMFAVEPDTKTIPTIPTTQPPTAGYKKRFLIRFGDTIKTILAEDIAYFFSENKATFARTTEGRTYPIDQNLDALDAVLNPEDFFRLNRQYIISLKAIDDMKAYSKARVIVTLKPAVKEPPIVSSERSAGFKQWLAGEL
ncbi:MAG: LytTR family DNA-binding domain-containing protein [Flavipsychrobacter sp.]